MITTYLQMLNSSLIRKKTLLEKILKLTEEQHHAFQEEKDTILILEECVLRKEPLIRQLNEIDEGFDMVYSKIKESVITDPKQYKNEISELQKSILSVTELGVKIQSLEQMNKLKFEVYSKERRQEIKQFKMSNRTVTNYYKSMTGNPQGDSYFIDKKK